MKKTKVMWTPREDAELTAAVHELGASRWRRISEHLKINDCERSSKQCRERWMQHLKEGLNKGEWSPEEDDVLLRLFGLHGNKWAFISRHVAGRTDNMVKNRLHTLVNNTRTSTPRDVIHIGNVSDDRNVFDSIFDSDDDAREPPPTRETPPRMLRVPLTFRIRSSMPSHHVTSRKLFGTFGSIFFKRNVHASPSTTTPRRRSHRRSPNVHSPKTSVHLPVPLEHVVSPCAIPF
jgi:hypothetical protein